MDIGPFKYNRCNKVFSMRIVSIVNAWACCAEFLPHFIKNHLQFADGIIIVWSQSSNHGVKNDAVLEYMLSCSQDSRVEFVQLEPMKGVKPLQNETRKRNHGIDIAKQKGFTHFLICDLDEFWDHEVMERLKIKIEENNGINGFVHPLKVFIKLPTLYCDDHTLVPGIQKMRKDSYVGNFKEYPFAYDEKGNAHIDPSRRPNTLTGIVYSPAPMAHMSYVRKNIDLKIDNSSANLKRSRQVIYDELRDAKPGYVSRLYHQPLKETENFFNLPLSW
jgi:hypothetical protein